MAIVGPSDAMKIPVKTDVLFRNHAAFVARFLSRLGVGCDELDDAVQEVFLVVHRNGGYTPGPATPTSYLASIAIRAAANHRRRGRKSRDRKADVTPDETSSPGQDPARSLETHESLEQLQEALDGLDPTLKATLVLAELEGENCTTIAAAFRVPVGTVYWRLHRARKAFKVALESRALARESRVHPGRRPLGQAVLGSILFGRSPAGQALQTGRGQRMSYDVATALARFHELLRAGANLPPWASGAVMAGAGAGLGLTSPAVLSVVAAIHLTGMGVAHVCADGPLARAGGGLPSATSTVVMASVAEPHTFERAIAAPAKAAEPLETPSSEAPATVEPPRSAPFERARLASPSPGQARVSPTPPPPDSSGANEVQEIQGIAAAERLLDASPADALVLVQSGDANFGAGYLAEERRYIGVIALFKLGRLDEARAQAAVFLKDYPDGPYSPRVQAATLRRAAR
jgi:RNA polymerase sigma-70 factor (ECF subfamily)